MSTIKSRKQKSRRLQNEVADMIRRWCTGCDPSEVKPVVMSESGPDILVYGAAAEQWPWKHGGECKAQEKINIWEAMKQAEKYDGPLWFKRNHSPIYVCIKAEEFFELF